jgi:flagellum-specific ATP synthase
MPEQLLAAAAPEQVGRVAAVRGLGLDVVGLRAAVGDVVEVGGPLGPVPAEVVALDEGRLALMPLARLAGVRAGATATRALRPSAVPVGPGLRGRVLDGLGRPVDGKGPLAASARVPLGHPSPAALLRARVTEPLQTGVRVLDTLTTLARGQRMGLFAGSGVGKSSLLSMVAHGTDAAVTVIALVGERGREVREFLEDDLGAAGLARSIVVVATADEPALMRRRAAFLATRIAEAEREAGRHVVLMMDSLTRVAMAQREIGLSAGEPPATRGYPPSTFAVLAELLERAGADDAGTITGIYTVLVDGDDHNEPIADSARSLLDGHVVLRRELAIAGRYPAVDPLTSISRLAGKVTDPRDGAAAASLRAVLSAREQARDLVDVGAYRPGANELVDRALANETAIAAFLGQPLAETVAADASWRQLHELVAALEGTPLPAPATGKESA